jgi:GDPmannose 4,6-dehydratase
MKKVLISGATGQDGSFMAEYLLENTDNTLILAARRTSQAILSNIEHLLNNPRVKLITLDLSDGEAIRDTIRTELPDYFINLGAQTFVADSWKHSLSHMQVNATALIHILEAVREYCSTCRVYSAGSSEQFGNGNHPYSPRSMYGVSKCTASLIAKVYRESYTLYVVHGILYNHESERRQDYFVTRKITTGVARIKKALELGQEFEPIELGNVDAKRDWSHAEDFVRGIWRMLNQEKYLKETFEKNHIWENGCATLMFEGKFIPKEYILASGETHSIKEFCEEAFHSANINNVYWFQGSQEEYDSLWLQGMDDMGRTIQEKLVVVNPKYYRPADVEHLCGDSTAARQELGWKPQISFKELVNRMVQNDLKNA